MTETKTRSKRPSPFVEEKLDLIDWGSRGAARALTNDRVVDVQRGIPGEDVVATIDRKRRPRRGVAQDILRPSPARVAPPCPYYLNNCGGCQWQHLGYGDQLETKRMLVDREMERAGVDARVQGVHAMDEPWRYRHTAAIALGWEAGFRPLLRRGIVEIHDCLISHPLIGRLADRMNEVLRAGRLPNYHGKVWLDLTVVGSPSEPALQVLIQGVEGLTLEAHPELPEVGAVISEIDDVTSVAFRHRSGRPEPLVGDLMATIEVARRPMFLPAGSFFQTNLAMVPRVLTRMREFASELSVSQAADIYGGVGTLGLPLASVVDNLTLIELDPLAVEAARRTANSWGLHNVAFVSRHAEKALSDLPALDLAIVDPPRSGLGAVVTDALIANGVPWIFYLSCAPSSLADDLAALQVGSFHVQSLDIFDFYPQTYHVESLVVLSRC